MAGRKKLPEDGKLLNSTVRFDKGQRVFLKSEASALNRVKHPKDPKNSLSSVVREIVQKYMDERT